MAKDLAQKYTTECITFVADDNGKLIGFISGEVKEKKYRVYSKEGYISDWFIEIEYRSQGIGKELLDALTEIFVKEGCTHLGLQTHLENTKAIEIYEHLGFTKRLVTFFKPLRDLP